MSSVRPEAIRPVLAHSRTYEVTVARVFSDTGAVLIFSLAVEVRLSSLDLASCLYTSQSSLLCFTRTDILALSCALRTGTGSRETSLVRTVTRN